MRRATGPLLGAWLVATFGAVWVAWFSVHPVTEQGFGERPPVQRPEIADAPFDSNDPSQSLSRHVRNPTTNGPVQTSPRPWMTGRVSPTRPTGSPVASGSPSFGSTTPSPVVPSAVTTATYQEASAEGGTATFEYTETGDVNLIEVAPNPGWGFNTYRYSRNWVEVAFYTYGRRSIVAGYFDNGTASVYTIEQQTR